MATGALLRQLIKSGSEGDSESFRRISEKVIQEEREKQHHLLANDLEKILYGRRSSSEQSKRFVFSKLPEDKERGLALLQIKEPLRRIDDVVLSDDNRSLLDEILEEHHRVETLKSHGLFPSDRLLFCGPPGCGKTLSAEIVAAELSLPLAIVRIDSVISSYLGETAANLRKVFDFIAAVPMIVLFDEFDALAKERADSAEHGELKRVVNAFLQMLDAYDGKSLLIAATNHEGILDSAIWRRFDEVLVFEAPDLEQIKRLLTIKLKGIRRDFETDSSKISGLFKGMSHADIERVLRRAIKEKVLSGKEFLTERHIHSALRREDARRSRVAKQE